MTAVSTGGRALPEIGFIQYLRGIAAMMVVFHHAHGMIPAAANWSAIGSRGVDIFFVISGFVMTYSTAGNKMTPAEFFVKRLLRVVPLYWIALAYATRRQWLGGTADVDLARDFFFIPHFFSGNSGPIWPAMVPGWTINYEMFFYVLFALCMLLGRLRLPALVLLLLASMLGNLWPHPDAAAYTFYTDPIILEFAFGIGVATIYLLGPKLRSMPQLISMLLVSTIALLFGAAGTEQMRWLYAGVPAAFIVYAAACLSPLTRGTSSTLAALGAASYSIYLFHQTGFAIPGKLLNPHLIETASSPLAMAGLITVFVAAGTLLGVVMHYALEKPVLKALRLGWERARRRWPVTAN